MRLNMAPIQPLGEQAPGLSFANHALRIPRKRTDPPRPPILTLKVHLVMEPISAPRDLINGDNADVGEDTDDREASSSITSQSERNVRYYSFKKKVQS